MSGIQRLNPFRLHDDVRVKDKSDLVKAMEHAEKGRLGHRGCLWHDARRNSW